MENEFDEEDLEPGTGIEPELLDGQCLSLLQLKEAVDICLARMESEGVDPSTVPCVVLGKAEHGEGEVFHLRDIFFGSKEDGTEWEACLITDMTGEDPVIADL